MYLLFVTELSLDDKDAKEEIEVVDILEGNADDSWLLPWVPDESVISEDVDEEDDSGSGNMNALSCGPVWCNMAGLLTLDGKFVKPTSEKQENHKINIMSTNIDTKYKYYQYILTFRHKNIINNYIGRNCYLNIYPAYTYYKKHWQQNVFFMIYHALTLT